MSETLQTNLYQYVSFGRKTIFYALLYIPHYLLRQIQIYTRGSVLCNVMRSAMRTNHFLSQLELVMDRNIYIDMTVSRDIPVCCRLSKRHNQYVSVNPSFKTYLFYIYLYLIVTFTTAHSIVLPPTFLHAVTSMTD